MSKIRVLVADDAVVVRRLLANVLTSDPAIEMVGTAANGKIALAKLTQVNPDVVLLDVEMPELNGLQTLAALRQTHPRLPVIMFSTLTNRGAAATLDALALGANDYVTKPANLSSPDEALERIRDQLIPKIKLFGQPKATGAGPAASAPRSRTATSTTRPASGPNAGSERIDIVAIGISTGGPNALAELIPTLPEDLPVPLLIVQHMPPLFTKFLAERLTKHSRIKVAEGVTGAQPRPGHAWIAPGDFHMEVVRDAQGSRLRLHQGAPENSCRPAADVLFRSVAAAYGPRVLAVVMTGMGQDGLRGCERVREAGGQIFVQDESSSVVWGMPGFVARAGLADQILPLDQLGPAIIRRVQAGRRVAVPV